MRTDQWWLCTHCWQRYGVPVRCPGCDEPGLDVRRWKARSSALHRLLARHGQQRDAAAQDDAAVRYQRIAIAARTPGSTEGRVTLRGRVRALQVGHSALAELECVAFRLVGHGPAGPVDDSAGTSFEVVGDPAGDVIVVLGQAGFDLPPDSPAQPVVARSTLGRFLNERGVYPSAGAVALCEAVLCDGDEVVVEGCLEQPSRRAHSYRGSARPRRLVDQPGSPLFVRKR